MISITPKGINLAVSGLTVYLDNWALIDFAKDDTRRRRFIRALGCGIDLLFSVTNAAELSGSQGKSADAVRHFLDEIGPHWFPVQLDVTQVVKLESQGVVGAFAARDFVESLFKFQMRQTDIRNVIHVSTGLLSLSAVMDWVPPQRDSISKTSAEFDHLIKEKLSEVHAMWKQHPAFFDRKFPIIAFDSTRRANFVYHNLLRNMAIKSDSLKKGDGMDFCHAVLSCAFSSFAALDTQWKRRLQELPPNPLARIYSSADLDCMLTDMEVSLERVHP